MIVGFDHYGSPLCRKVERKLEVLARSSNSMGFLQNLILMKTFIKSQLGYCTLI